MRLKQHGILYEAGHYYSSHGITSWSNLGLQIAAQVKKPEDHIMLFIDDVHPIQNVAAEEIVCEITTLKFVPELQVMESAMRPWAEKALDQLMALPRGKRPKVSEKGCFCSGFPIKNQAGEPLCVLLEVGLALYKQSLGYKRIVNILPHFYKDEQNNVARLMRKIMPEDFEFSTIFFDHLGKQERIDWCGS